MPRLEEPWQQKNHRVCCLWKSHHPRQADTDEHMQTERLLVSKWFYKGKRWEGRADDELFRCSQNNHNPHMCGILALLSRDVHLLSGHAPRDGFYKISLLFIVHKYFFQVVRCDLAICSLTEENVITVFSRPSLYNHSELSDMNPSMSF